MKATARVPEKPGQLRRAPTPYPKELRAMAKHARNIHKDGTQDITPPMQNAVHIKAAKITPTLQQRFASDNKKEPVTSNSENDPASHQHSPGSVQEAAYMRGQPPPYHIAAPYTKHAQYFNGTGG
ncbi:unnamed protein product, partial [Iphiclides podalirius]